MRRAIGCVVLVVMLAGAGAVHGAILTAAADDSNSLTTFGPTVSATVNLTESYVGVGSQPTSTVNGPGGGPLLGTTAEILWGTNSTGSDTSVDFAWRTRTQSETWEVEGGSPTSPPLWSPHIGGMVSDILDLSGMANDGSGEGETDIFVLQMSYVDILPYNEAYDASTGDIAIFYLNPNGGGEGIPKWENAILGNFGENASEPKTGVVLSSWEDAGSPTALGTWGVDTTNNVAWAVLNHNSQFAVQPEPGTLALLGISGMGMAVAALRRKAKARR